MTIAAVVDEPTTNRAVRTVSETDDIHVIEGLGIPFGGPFGGRDTYGTFASARTDFHWDLFPDVVPSATRSDEPKFIRPQTFHHGFDVKVGLARIGGWSPTRTDDDGVWVQAQLDKHQKHYAKVRALLDKGALDFSVGSAEHSVRIDEKTGEWLDWPVYELALTPTASNPYAQIAARSAHESGLLRVAAQDKVEGEAAEKPATRTFSEAAMDAGSGAMILSQLYQLLADEADEPDQAPLIQGAIDSLEQWLALESDEIGTPEDTDESAAESQALGAYMSAVRIGKRNNATDAGRIQDMHDLSTQLGAACASEPTARSAEEPPALRIVAAEKPDVNIDEVRDLIRSEAVRTAREMVRDLTDG